MLLGLGFVVKGIYDDIKIDSYEDVPYGGRSLNLLKTLAQEKIDRIYIAMSMKDETRLRDIISINRYYMLCVTYSWCFTFNILQSRTEEINGVPVVPLFDTPLNGINMVFKRIEDVVVSSIILLLISPVLCTIAVIVKVTSPTRYIPPDPLRHGW